MGSAGLTCGRVQLCASKALLGSESELVPSTGLSTGAEQVAVSVLVGCGSWVPAVCTGGKWAWAKSFAL